MDLQESLSKIGFSKNEVKIIILLKDNISLSAKDIAKEARIPRTKVYPVLKRLIQDHRVIELIDKTPKHFALANLQNLSDELIDIARILSGGEEKNYAQAPVSVIHGREGIINWLQDGNVNLRKYSNNCTYLDRDFPASVYRKTRRITKKGIIYKFLTIYEEKNNKIYKKWIAAGVRVRFFDPKLHGHPLPRSSIMDGELFRLTIGKPDVPTDDMFISFVGKNKAIAQALNKYFLEIWKKSRPAEEVMNAQSK